MKLIFSSYLIYHLLLKKKFKKENNYYLELFIVPFLGIIIYLIIYLPIYFLFGEHLLFSILWLLIVIIIEIYLRDIIFRKKDFQNGFVISMIAIIAMYIVFLILTYFPPHNFLFIDTTTNTYGINKGK